MVSQTDRHTYTHTSIALLFIKGNDREVSELLKVTRAAWGAVAANMFLRADGAELIIKGNSC